MDLQFADALVDAVVDPDAFLPQEADVELLPSVAAREVAAHVYIVVAYNARNDVACGHSLPKCGRAGEKEA